MSYAIDSLKRQVEDADRDRDTHAEELAELTAQRDAAREDLAAIEEYLAGIVRVWQREGDDERRMADVFVPGLRREIEEARDSRQGAWWEVSRG